MIPQYAGIVKKTLLKEREGGALRMGIAWQDRRPYVISKLNDKQDYYMKPVPPPSPARAEGAKYGEKSHHTHTYLV